MPIQFFEEIAATAVFGKRLSPAGEVGCQASCLSHKKSERLKGVVGFAMSMHQDVCPNCRQPLESGDTYCRECGSRIDYNDSFVPTVSAQSNGLKVSRSGSQAKNPFAADRDWGKYLTGRRLKPAEESRWSRVIFKDSLDPSAPPETSESVEPEPEEEPVVEPEEPEPEEEPVVEPEEPEPAEEPDDCTGRSVPQDDAYVIPPEGYSPAQQTDKETENGKKSKSELSPDTSVASPTDKPDREPVRIITRSSGGGFGSKEIREMLHSKKSKFGSHS